MREIQRRDNIQIKFNKIDNTLIIIKMVRIFYNNNKNYIPPVNLSRNPKLSSEKRIFIMIIGSRSI